MMLSESTYKILYFSHIIRVQVHFNEEFSESKFSKMMTFQETVQNQFFKLRIGAFIPRSVNLSLCLSTPKITKLYKTLQNITKHQKMIK